MNCGYFNMVASSTSSTSSTSHGDMKVGVIQPAKQPQPSINLSAAPMRISKLSEEEASIIFECRKRELFEKLMGQLRKANPIAPGSSRQKQRCQSTYLPPSHGWKTNRESSIAAKESSPIVGGSPSKHSKALTFTTCLEEVKNQHSNYSEKLHIQANPSNSPFQTLRSAIRTTQNYSSHIIASSHIIDSPEHTYRSKPAAFKTLSLKTRAISYITPRTQNIQGGGGESPTKDTSISPASKQSMRQAGVNGTPSQQHKISARSPSRALSPARCALSYQKASFINSPATMKDTCEKAEKEFDSPRPQTSASLTSRSQFLLNSPTQTKTNSCGSASTSQSSSYSKQFALKLKKSMTTSTFSKTNESTWQNNNLLSKVKVSPRRCYGDKVLSQTYIEQLQMRKPTPEKITKGDTSTTSRNTLTSPSNSSLTEFIFLEQASSTPRAVDSSIRRTTKSKVSVRNWLERALAPSLSSKQHNMYLSSAKSERVRPSADIHSSQHQSPYY